MFVLRPECWSQNQSAPAVCADCGTSVDLQAPSMNLCCAVSHDRGRRTAVEEL